MAPPDEPNGRFRLSRSIDLAALVAVVALAGTVVFAFFSGYSGVTAQQVKLDAKFELLDQRMKNDESIAADKRVIDTAFAAEVRAGLASLAQSVADLRTLVASQDNVKRR
jgi:hypothetical protein